MLNIDEKKLIEEMTKHFATKTELYELRTEVRDGFKSMEENFKEIGEKLSELKSLYAKSRWGSSLNHHRLTNNKTLSPPISHHIRA